MRILKLKRALGYLLKNNHFDGLFAQTPAYKAFPEFLAVDATYKILETGIHFYLLLTEDGNCQSEVVAICLLTNKTKQF